MMKLLLATTPLLLVACVQNMPMQPSATTGLAALPKEAPRQGQYIALPGQAAVDTDAAFEQQVAAYNNTPSQPSVPQPVVVQQPMIATPAQPTVVNPLSTLTQPVQSFPMVDYMGTQANQYAQAAHQAVSGMMPGTESPAVSGTVDYTLRITNATRGRVFIEAQDAAGEIYPCGFMTASQSISSEKKQVAPIKGPITVVVRDPDKEGAPELRRYKVTPPTGYAGKTLEITIISGGLYQVSVDGQVRYITPTPVGKPDLGNAASTSPAEAAAAEAAKAPAAPEQTPAGI